MKIFTAAYSPFGELLPSQQYQIISTFEVERGDSAPPIIRGAWTARPDLGPGRIEPIYLTQAQLDNLEFIPDAEANANRR